MSQSLKIGCYFYNKEDECCNALNELYCENSDKCVFRKTKEEKEMADRKAEERIASLPKEKQVVISQKYYNGKKTFESHKTIVTPADNTVIDFDD